MKNNRLNQKQTLVGRLCHRKRVPGRASTAFTLLELFVVLGVIGVLIALLLPATRSSREAARRMSCSNNFRQLGLGIHNYHSAYDQLPMQMTGTFDPHSNHGGTDPPGNNRYRLSWLVGISPFIEAQSVWEVISNEDGKSSQFAPMGPAPWTRQFEPWQTEIPTLRCPSDPGQGLPGHGRTNYAACIGDATHWLNTGATRWNSDQSVWVADRKAQVAASGRGMFVPRQMIRFRDVADGLANTIMAGEIVSSLEDGDKRSSGSLENSWDQIHDLPLLCQDQIDPARPNFWLHAIPQPEFADQARGMRWADAAGLYTSFNTILPPNSEVCLAGGDSGIGTLPSSSYHQGGCHILLGDGSVSFVTDSVDTGDTSIGPVIIGGEGARSPESESPYGVWGAMGTRAMAESIES